MTIHLSPPNPIKTERLVLRCCGPECAPLVREAIDVSIPHLRAWMPWAMQEPRSLEETRQIREWQLSRFKSGEDFSYSIFNLDETEIMGGAGIHLRDEPDCLEIGYWIRADRINKGYATEATRALTIVALELPGIARVQIDCDPANKASRRIPEKLGYQLIEKLLANKLTPTGQPRDTVVYEMTAVDHLASGADR